MAYQLRPQMFPSAGQVTPNGGTVTQAGAPAATVGTNGLLTLPEYIYTPSEGYSNPNGRLAPALGDYYGQMGNTYLPQIDQFATDNAGQMVAFSPDQFMTVEDFGLDANRGRLPSTMPLGYSVVGQRQSGYSGLTEDGQQVDKFYVDSGNGNFQPVSAETNDEYGSVLPTDGQEVFARKDNPNGGSEDPYMYESQGAFHKETPEEAFARMQKNGGAHASGGALNDFGGNDTLDALSSDQSSDKWGKDFVNDPQFAQYVNDPNWVQRDDKGNVTAVRAELLPFIFREEIGGQLRGINRGSTETFDAFGTLIKTVVIAGISYGFGVVGAVASGLTTPIAAGTTATGLAGSILPAGTGLSATGSIVAGGIQGGVGAAMNGGDVGKGVLLGGIGGGVGPLVSDGLAGTGIDLLAKGTVGNSVLTGGVTGAAKSAVTGGDIGKGFVVGAAGGGFRGVMKEFGLSTGSDFTDNIIGNVFGSTVGSLLGGDAQDPTAPQTSPRTTPQKTTTPAPQASNTTYAPISQGRIKYKP